MANSRRVVKRTRSISRAKASPWSFSAWVNRLKPANLKAYWFSKRGRTMAIKVVGAGFLVVFLTFLYFAKDLPSPNKINALLGDQTTRFYDRTGNTVLYEVHGDVNRTVIDFNQMPENMKQATVAIEDKDFYKHGAFSSIGILRAAFVDLSHRGSGLQGGSTITQQYVKNALLNDSQSVTRKAKELILSIEIEQLYKKDDILKLYLNEIPYSTQAYGIQAAAKTYFGKDAKDLTLPESALLAGIPNAPTYYSPYGDHTDALVERQHRILDLMAQQKYITQQQADEAKKVDVLAEIPPVPRTFANVTAPYFVKYVESKLDQKYGSKVVDAGGLKVITTLDLEKQKAAEDAINKNMKTVRSLGGTNAALVAEDPKNGQVTAWVGGSDFSASQVDVANSERQPGSSFKPFVYSTLFGKQTGSTWGPGSTIYDVTTDFGGGYQPHNYCLCNYGAVSIRQAIGSSLNIPAVKALYMAGISNSIQTAHNLGITTLQNDPEKYGLSLVLGSGEVKLADMVSGYSGFASGGTHVQQQTVLKIYDAKGKALEDNTKAPTPKKVLDPQVAYELNSILTDESARRLTFGANFAPLILPGKTAAVKTGTTENFRDAWTIGYTQSTVGGVWTGNNDGHSMSGSSGAVAAPIWHDFMVAATKNEANQPFTQPTGIKTVSIDAITGRVPSNATKQTRSDVFAAWYKAPAATDTKSAKVDKLSGKLATDCTPTLAVDTVYSSAIQAEIPATDAAFPRWNAAVQALAAKLGFQQGTALPTENDDRHSCSDQKPIVNLTVTGSGPLHIKVSYKDGTFNVNKLEIKFDDQVISTQSPVASNPYSFDYDAPSTGSHNITATVTDDGYYQTTDQQTATVTNTGSGFVGLAPHNGSTQPHALVIFQWSNVSGASGYKLYYRRAGGSYSSTIVTNNSTSLTNIPPGNYDWYVEAYNGLSLMDTTPDYTFTAA